eukprot:2554985-Prymnesium_polylepis.2
MRERDIDRSPSRFVLSDLPVDLPAYGLKKSVYLCPLWLGNDRWGESREQRSRGVLTLRKCLATCAPLALQYPPSSFTTFHTVTEGLGSAPQPTCTAEGGVCTMVSEFLVGTDRSIDR